MTLEKKTWISDSHGHFTICRLKPSAHLRNSSAWGSAMNGNWPQTVYMPVINVCTPQGLENKSGRISRGQITDVMNRHTSDVPRLPAAQVFFHTDAAQSVGKAVCIA